MTKDAAIPARNVRELSFSRMPTNNSIYHSPERHDSQAPSSLNQAGLRLQIPWKPSLDTYAEQLAGLRNIHHHTFQGQVEMPIAGTGVFSQRHDLFRTEQKPADEVGSIGSMSGPQRWELGRSNIFSHTSENSDQVHIEGSLSDDPTASDPQLAGAVPHKAANEANDCTHDTPSASKPSKKRTRQALDNSPTSGRHKDKAKRLRNARGRYVRASAV